MRLERSCSRTSGVTNPRSGPFASGPLYSCFLECNQSNKSAVPVTGQRRRLHCFDEAMKHRNASSGAGYPVLASDQAGQTLATHLVASNLKAPPTLKALTRVLLDGFSIGVRTDPNWMKVPYAKPRGSGSSQWKWAA
jgi:hypothetical protein